MGIRIKLDPDTYRAEIASEDDETGHRRPWDGSLRLNYRDVIELHARLDKLIIAGELSTGVPTDRPTVT